MMEANKQWEELSEVISSVQPDAGNIFSTLIQYKQDFLFDININSKIYPTEKGTYIIEQLRPDGQVNFRNVNRQGQVICQTNISFANIISVHMMPGNKVVIWAFVYLYVKKYWTIQWDPQTNKKIYLREDRDKKLDRYNSPKLYTFPQSKLLCIVQREKPIQMNRIQKQIFKQQLRICYYKYPLLSDNDKPIHIFKSKDHQILLGYQQFGKINNRSGILWKTINQKLLNTVQIHIYDFQLSIGQIRTFSINLDQCSKKTQMTEVWEVTKGILYAKFQIEYQYQEKVNIQQFSPKSTLEIMWNYLQGTYHIPKFTKSIKYQRMVQFTNCLRSVIKVSNKEKWITVPPYSLKKSKKDILPVLYISIQSELPLFFLKGQSNVHVDRKILQYYPQFDNKMHFQAQLINNQSNKTYFKITYRRLSFQPNIIYSHMISQMIQNVDEALIEQTVQLLKCQFFMQENSGRKWKRAQVLQNSFQ